MESIFIKGLKAKFYHPVTGEEYEFVIESCLFAYPKGRQSDARLTLVCYRGGQRAEISIYDIQPMNDFSLFAFFNQYRDLLENWLLTATTEAKITQAEIAFSKGPGPIIKISGKASKSTALVEVIKD